MLIDEGIIKTLFRGLIEGIGKKVTKITSQSTDDEYPSAKAVKDYADEVSTISDGGITTNKIADSAIVSQKIANDAITGDKIKNGVVTSSKISNSSVETGKLANKAVTEEKLSDSVNTKLDKLPDINPYGADNGKFVKIFDNKYTLMAVDIPVINKLNGSFGIGSGGVIYFNITDEITADRLENMVTGSGIVYVECANTYEVNIAQITGASGYGGNYTFTVMIPCNMSLSGTIYDLCIFRGTSSSASSKPTFTLQGALTHNS